MYWLNLEMYFWTAVRSSDHVEINPMISHITDTHIPERLVRLQWTSSTVESITNNSVHTGKTKGRCGGALISVTVTHCGESSRKCQCAVYQSSVGGGDTHADSLQKRSEGFLL